MIRFTRGLMLIAAVGTLMAIAPTDSAQADHRHRRSQKSFGLYFNNGSFGFSVNRSYARPRVHVPVQPYFHNPVRYRHPRVVAPAPTCCRLRRVWVPGHYDHYGHYCPGYYRLVKVCTTGHHHHH